MSLTILVKNDSPVTIVRWFLESRGLVLYACGPIVQMSPEEFRRTGHEWVSRHFQEYAGVRLPLDKIVKPFESKDAKKLMQNRRVLQIHIDPDENLIFSPMEVERYGLAYMKRVKPVCERRIPEGGSAEVFWKAFDEALADAPPA